MYILIDIGGTKTRVALTEHREAILPPLVFETPHVFEEWFNKLIQETTTLLQGRKVHGVIVGVPGRLTEDKGSIKNTPHLPQWNGVELKKRIEDRFTCTCILENDTALVGLGEAWYGAGKGYPIVAYVTISTGVNGVRIVNGKIDSNIFGFEIGHTIVNDNKSVEYFISGSALEERYGKPSHEVHNVAVWAEVNHYAGVLGANVTMFWSPSIIVYGGPVMNDLHIEIIEKEAKQVATMYDVMPVFIRGTLKDFGGLYGALALSKEIQETPDRLLESISIV
jgi:predicted NBD/HSP70 family sugar kinase